MAGSIERVVGSPGKGVVFDFRMIREREGLRQCLGLFSGILHTSGYVACSLP